MKITVLYGTETGNCKGVADKVAKKGAKNGVEVDVIDLATYTVEEMETLENPVLIIISTWDDGAPPPRCVAFCEALKNSTDVLSKLNFTVLALGDKEYPLFCECGRQIDAKLGELGANRILERTELGAEFMVTYIGWSKRFWKTMAGFFGVAA